MTRVTLCVTPITSTSRTITQPLNHAVTHHVTHLTHQGQTPRPPYKGARDPNVNPSSTTEATA